MKYANKIEVRPRNRVTMVPMNNITSVKIPCFTNSEFILPTILTKPTMSYNPILNWKGEKTRS